MFVRYNVSVTKLESLLFQSAKYEFASSNTTRTTFAFDACYGVTSDERSGIGNLSQPLTRTSTYQTLQTRTWPTART
jgi:hypothetical protein